MSPFTGKSGTDPSIGWGVISTGGIVLLDLASTAAPESWSLVRSVVGVSGLTNQTVLVSGAAEAIPVYIDLGDGNNQNVPLDPATLYQYEFSTSQGVATTDTICVSGTIVLEPDHMTRLMARAMQAGLASLVLPTHFMQKATFSYAMPIVTQLRFPMVLMNLDLLQQTEIPIGQGLQTDYQKNFNSYPSIALRRYVLRVFTTNVDERDFYRDAVIGIFNTILTPLFQRIGQDVNHTYQASNGQIVGDQMNPGAFYAEIALQFAGLYNVGVSTYFPTIEAIAFAVSSKQDDADNALDV